MFTIDASVHINALNPTEVGSADSQAFLERLRRDPRPIFSPTLLLVEVAGAVARSLDDAGQGMAIAHALRDITRQIWAPLDEAVAEEALRLAAERRLRGADAVYAAVARRYRTLLVTRDVQQLERLPPIVPVSPPEEAFARLDEMLGTENVT
jgi:predicted nucleic acid-binding protein